jgi:glutamate 5-kinase
MADLMDCSADECSSEVMTAPSASKKLVVKVGSSTLTTSVSSVDMDYLADFARQVASLRDAGWQVVVVSSGAIAAGLGALGMRLRPNDMPSLQAAASVGAVELARSWADAFAGRGIVTSSVLLTRRDTADRTSYLHARDTLLRLLELGVVPIVNENDTVSVEQIKFGDNDTLAALVACLIDADLMVILSDIDGLYDANPAHDASAKLLARVTKIDKRVLDMAGGAGSSVGSGGMVTKLRAARVLMAAGIDMVIAKGSRDDALVDAVSGIGPHTKFTTNEDNAEGAPTQQTPLRHRHAITPRKLWLALGDSSRGSVEVDPGAARALDRKGASLLSVGVKGASGDFDEGDVIDVVDADGFILARGKTAFSKDELELAIGRSRDELASNRILAEFANKPLIHRDDMMIF